MCACGAYVHIQARYDRNVSTYIPPIRIYVQNIAIPSTSCRALGTRTSYLCRYLFVFFFTRKNSINHERGNAVVRESGNEIFAISFSFFLFFAHIWYFGIR